MADRLHVAGDYIDVRRASELTGYSVSYLRRQTLTLPHKRAGGTVIYFEREALIAWANEKKRSNDKRCGPKPSKRKG